MQKIGPIMKKVLIVEDDPVIADIIETILVQKGYMVTGKVRTGEEALFTAASEYPDCVLMDISLASALSGITTAHYLTRLFNIPVIFITGCTDDESIQRAQHVQAQGLISKPFKPLDITTNVSIAISNHKAMPVRSDFNEQLMRKIMSMIDAVIITDNSGRVILINPYAEHLLDVNWSEVIFKPIHKLLLLLNSRTGEKIDDPIKNTIKESIAIGIEHNLTIVSMKGKKRAVSIRAQPIIDSKNEKLGVMIFIHEKTYQEKKAEIPSDYYR